jgi:hypothetical protein
MIDAFEVVPE